VILAIWCFRQITDCTNAIYHIYISSNRHLNGRAKPYNEKFLHGKTF